MTRNQKIRRRFIRRFGEVRFQLVDHARKRAWFHSSPEFDTREAMYLGLIPASRDAHRFWHYLAVYRAV